MIWYMEVLPRQNAFNSFEFTQCFHKKSPFDAAKLPFDVSKLPFDAFFYFSGFFLMRKHLLMIIIPIRLLQRTIFIVKYTKVIS